MGYAASVFHLERFGKGKVSIAKKLWELATTKCLPQEQRVCLAGCAVGLSEVTNLRVADRVSCR